MYAKIFDSILRSSVWANHPPHVRVAWIGLLLLARPGRLPDGRRVGIVQGTRLGLARALSLEPEQFEEALRVLTAPDPDSTSTDYEGRRILELKPNRWAIVNFCRYQRMRDDDRRRIQSRELMRELREARKRSGEEGTNSIESTTSARCANNANIFEIVTEHAINLNESRTSARCANNANIFEIESSDSLNRNGSTTSARCANNANIANTATDAVAVPGDRNPDTESAILARSDAAGSAILARPPASRGAEAEFSTGFPQGTVPKEQVVDSVGDVRTFSTAFPQVFHSFSTAFPQAESAVVASKTAQLHKNECTAYYYDQYVEKNKSLSDCRDRGNRGELKGGEGGKGGITSPALFADQKPAPQGPSEATQPKRKKSSASAVWALQPGEEPVMTFPCQGETDTWALSPSALRWLRGHYRTVDVEAELRSAQAWLVANPGRIKTARGMPRFLVNWLETAARDRRGFKRQPDLLAGVEDLLRGAGEGGDE